MIQITNAFGTRAVRVIGAGAYVPPRAVDNDRITQAIPGWSADWIAEKTQIRERRFLWELDPQAGVTVAPPATAGEPVNNTDMCEAALRKAIAMAGIDGSEISPSITASPTVSAWRGSRRRRRASWCHTPRRGKWPRGRPTRSNRRR